MPTPTPIQSALPPPPSGLPVPPSTQDELADDAVASAANAGGIWIVLSVIAFAVGLAMPNPAAFGIVWLIGFVLFVIGMVRRRQIRRRVTARVDPAAVKRARWRRWAGGEAGASPVQARTRYVRLGVRLVVTVAVAFWAARR